MGPDLGSRRQILAQWPTAARSASPHGTGVTPNHHIAMLQNRLPAGRRGGLTAVFRVIAHLASLVGASVKVTLEIEADVPSGAPDHVVRTVTENSRTLKFSSYGFEQE